MGYAINGTPSTLMGNFGNVSVNVSAYDYLKFYVISTNDGNSGMSYLTISNFSFTYNLLTPTLSNFSFSTKTYGNSPFAITAPTSTSSGSFSYTSSNTSVAVISVNTIIIVGAGTATITANQSAYGNYSSGSTSATLTVNKATPTLVNFYIPSKSYGDLPFTITAPTSTSSGLFTYTSSNTDVATIFGNIITITGAGTTTITADQDEDNAYIPSSIAIEYIVNKSFPTLSLFHNLTKIYGDLSFTLSAPLSTSSGSFTYTSSNADVATISGNIVTITGVGTTTITASQSETNNYQSNSINATCSVEQSTPANPVNINSSDGLSCFMSTSSVYGDLSGDVVINYDTMSSEFRKILTSSNYIKITREN
jgi:hypothetical protein